MLNIVIVLKTEGLHYIHAYTSEKMLLIFVAIHLLSVTEPIRNTVTCLSRSGHTPTPDKRPDQE